MRARFSDHFSKDSATNISHTSVRAIFKSYCHKTISRTRACTVTRHWKSHNLTQACVRLATNHDPLGVTIGQQRKTMETCSVEHMDHA